MGFQIAAIIILLIFYGCYFGKMISQRGRGIQTDQMGKGKQGLAKFIEITMKIAAIFVVVIEVISICLNFSHLPAWARYVGIAAAVLGDFVFISSVITMKDRIAGGREFLRRIKQDLSPMGFISLAAIRRFSALIWST